MTIISVKHCINNDLRSRIVVEYGKAYVGNECYEENSILECY